MSRLEVGQPHLIVMDNSETFTELTNVNNIASTSCSTLDMQTQDLFQNADPVSEFHSFISELDGFPVAERHADNNAEIADVLEVETNEQEEEEEEDVAVKYPYQKKDIFEGLTSRIEKKMADGLLEPKAETDEKLEEITEMLRQQIEEDRLRAREEVLSKRILTKESFSVCLYCSKAFECPEDLNSHIERSHNFDGVRHKCHICGASYKMKKNLKIHLRNHESKPEFECKECNFVYRTGESLLAHITQKHVKVENAFTKVCEKCHQMIPLSVFKRHDYYCKNKEAIAMKRAEKKSMSVPASPAVPSVSSPASYVDKSCSVCKQTFASRQSMIRHVQRKHPEVSKDPSVTSVRYVSVSSPMHQYACTECGKRLTNKTALKYHQERTHKKLGGYGCHLCDKSYAIAHDLRKHIARVHSKPSDPEKERDFVNMEF